MDFDRQYASRKTRDIWLDYFRNDKVMEVNGGHSSGLRWRPAPKNEVAGLYEGVNIVQRGKKMEESEALHRNRNLLIRPLLASIHLESFTRMGASRNCVSAKVFSTELFYVQPN